MHEKLTVFTSVSPSYQYSSELALCLKLFRKALPENSRLLFSENALPGSLRQLIREHLSGLSAYVLIAKEPAMLLGSNSIMTLISILDEHQDITCVLPSDIRGYRPGRTAGYYTLRGFEHFSDSLPDQSAPVSPYDGRDPWMFLIRKSTLSEIDIPENPLEIPKILGPESTCISLNAYIHPFIDYYHETRADVIHLVPENVRTVLDIGCARGNFGASVKKKLGCRVVGIEMNAYEAEYARKNLDEFVVGDILSTEITETFDCVTCLDVIEHFVSPDLLLQKIRQLLNDGGHFLLSVPNVGHWSIIEDLIEGRWDYVPIGILTVSHLRFFTLKTIRSLLEDAGFTIVSISGQSSSLPSHSELWATFMEQHGLTVDRKSLSFLSYYIVTKK